MNRLITRRRLFRFPIARLVIALLVALIPSASRAVDLVSKGAVWFYLDDGSDQGTAWRTPPPGDDAWAFGPAQLGYGDSDEATLVNGGPVGDRIITTYFRTHFDVADPGTIPGLTLEILRDDGAVVYLNGTEIYRTNMPAGLIDYTTVAGSAWAVGTRMSSTPLRC